jgi:hypothetical protein
MSLTSLLAELVTIQTIGPVGTDRYNQPILGVASTVANVPARLEQTESTEVTVGEATLVSDWRIFLEPDEVISNASRIVDSLGRTFEVVGAPNLHRTPRGPHHLEARLRYVA